MQNALSIMSISSSTIKSYEIRYAGLVASAPILKNIMTEYIHSSEQLMATYHRKQGS